MILFDNWRIKYVGELLAHQYDNLSRTLLVKGVPGGYDWTMMVQVKENFDVIALAPMPDGVGVVLTAEQLSLAGYYSMQLVGTLKDDGVTKRHTNILQVYVDNSLSGDANWPTVPSEFSQVEANILELSKHPPIPGESGFWKIWDLDSHRYVESEFPLPEVSGTGGSSVELDTTLKEAGKAADAKAVGDALSTLTEEIVTTSESKVSAHNTGTDSHSDIRLLIQGLTDRLNALADSDDTTLDQLSEVVAYIKSNRDLISTITTDKVSVADIIDNLTTNVANKPLSAAQGVALKALIDAISLPTPTAEDVGKVPVVKGDLSFGLGEMPDKLPNPNALTFTGAVTGSYDGSAPVSVEIPSGGGAVEREWTMLGEIDISDVGGGNIELTDLDNFTEFYVTWGTVMNESTTNSGYDLRINGTVNARNAIPIQKAGSSASYGWMIARYNGLVWELQRSGGAVLNSNTTLNATNGMFPYNLFLDVGKATEFALVAPVPTYQAVSGIVKIYGR